MSNAGVVRFASALFTSHIRQMVEKVASEL